MSILRIYFSAQWRDSASLCPWALCEESGAVLQSGSGTLASMPKAKECIGIVAPERTVFLAVKTPSGARRQWKAALPFLAENQTLPEPEENHVVLGAAADGGQAHLVIADKAWLRRMVDACRTASLPMRKVVPEVLLPALAPSSWTLAWNGVGGFVRSGSSSGMAMDVGDAATPPVALQLMLNHAVISRPDKIKVRLMPNPSGVETTMPRWDNFPVPLVADEIWDWRRAPIAAEVTNLLAGELAPPSRPLEWWPKVRPVAYLVLAVLSVEMLGNNLQWAMLAYEKQSLKSAMEASFRKAFGSEAALVNAPLQMQRNIADIKHGAGLEDESDFIPLMNLSARALGKLPTGAMRELHYESGRLEVEVNVATASELAALQTSLRNSGLAVRADTHSAGNGFNSKLTLQLASAS